MYEVISAGRKDAPSFLSPKEIEKIARNGQFPYTIGFYFSFSFFFFFFFLYFSLFYYYFILLFFLISFFFFFFFDFFWIFLLNKI